MEIIILIKHVPDTGSILSIDSNKKSISEDNIKWIMNPYDEIALEEGLRIKDSQGGKITLLCVGNDKSVDILRKGLAMGADDAVLIHDDEIDLNNSLAIAKLISVKIKSHSFDLIISGQCAVDDGYGLVGPAVAVFLSIPHISFVEHVNISSNKLVCRQTMDIGAVTCETSFPALITAQRGLNEPRYPSMMGIMKAKKKEIEKKTLSDIGISWDQISNDKSKALITSMRLPTSQRTIKIIDGTSNDKKVKNLVNCLLNDRIL